MANMGGGTDNVHCIINDVPDLTEDEKDQLMTVMMKAKEFDAQEESKMRQPLEGQLFKYTNVVKGWQYRWFVLNPDSGYLEYYMMDEIRKNRPRGSVHLAGSVISPSDEDSQTFSVSAVCGEVYRLRASNAKERQFWVNRLRAVAEHHTQSIAEKNPPLPPRDLRSTPSTSSDILGASIRNQQDQTTWYSPLSVQSATSDSPAFQATPSVIDAFRSVRSMIQKSGVNLQELVKSVESLPSAGKHVHCCHQDMLLLKATAQATVTCLDQCYSILQQQQVTSSFPSGLPAGAKVEWVDSKSGKSSATSTPETAFKFSKPRSGASANQHSESSSPGVVDPSGEITDEEDKPLPSIDVPKNIIMENLSHLKHGADLTRFSFPAFGLEMRSMLEVYADVLGDPDLLFKVSECLTAADRIKSLLEWYATSIHLWRKGTVVRKPYNPLIGETFHCSWKVQQNSKQYKLTYVAEQVSHHPPISAWYAECPEKQIFITSTVSPKPQFLGFHASLVFHGEVSVYLLKHQETYTFNYPVVYVRSLLSDPWVEFGGKVVLACKETGCHGYVIFQTEPFSGSRDKAQRIIGETKDAQGAVLSKVSGCWSGTLHFTSSDGSTKEVDAAVVAKPHKRVRPIRLQDPMESRSLWHAVTVALKRKDCDTAGEEKSILEAKQRDEEEGRRRMDTKYKGKLFQEEGSEWTYKYALNQRSGQG